MQRRRLVDKKRRTIRVQRLSSRLHRLRSIRLRLTSATLVSLKSSSRRPNVSRNQKKPPVERKQSSEEEVESPLAASTTQACRPFSKLARLSSVRVGDASARVNQVIACLSSAPAKVRSGTTTPTGESKMKMNVEELLAASRLFEGETPSTGNCQIYRAGVTGLEVRALEDATSALKKGICASAELNFDKIICLGSSHASCWTVVKECGTQVVRMDRERS